VATRVIKVSGEITKTDVRDGVPRPLIVKLVNPSKILIRIVSVVNRHLGIDLPSGQLIEHLIIRKTAAHKTLVSHSEGQADVGFVTLLVVILITMRNEQKALKDLQVQDLEVLVPLTIQIHQLVEESGTHHHENRVLSRGPLQDLSLRQTGSGARDRATGPRRTTSHQAHSPNSFYLCGDRNSD